MKREVFSDAAVFRRGFYSCSEGHHDDVSEYSEMGRKLLAGKKVISEKEIRRKRRIRKKVRLIRGHLKRATPASRRSFPTPGVRKPS